MKPRIRQKGKNRDGTKRFILEYIKGGMFKTKALNPSKLVKILDSPKDKQKKNQHTDSK